MRLDEVEVVIQRLFPHLTEWQWQALRQLPPLYEKWNEKINVISRKDIDNFACNHLLHSMTLALFASFAGGTKIIDVGTGGGLPGIPLAILFPKCHFTLVDSIGKKVKVAESVVERVGLSNVKLLQARAESLPPATAHFVVSRAAMPMKELVAIARRLVIKGEAPSTLPNGILALKGGNLTDELHPFRKSVREIPLHSYLPELPFFETKKIIYYPV